MFVCVDTLHNEIFLDESVYIHNMHTFFFKLLV